MIPSDDTIVTGISAITAKYSQTGADVVDPAPLTRGELYILSATAITDPADGVNNGVIWSVVGQETTGTYISQTGNLQIGGTETATTITVTAESSWIDPSGVQVAGEKATRTFTLEGGLAQVFPKAEEPNPV